MPILARTKIGRGYRTTVPREVRKLLGIGESDEVEWIFEDGKVIIRKGAMGMATRCPYCGFEGELRLIKTWRYRFYDVKMFSCPNCRGVFNYYSGVSPTGKRSEFVVRLKPRARTPASRGGAR